jgi:hypothetical protein
LGLEAFFEALELWIELLARWWWFGAVGSVNVGLLNFGAS